jgi:hypothetical protein
MERIYLVEEVGGVEEEVFSRTERITDEEMGSRGTPGRRRIVNC